MKFKYGEWPARNFFSQLVGDARVRSGAGGGQPEPANKPVCRETAGSGCAGMGANEHINRTGARSFWRRTNFGNRRD